MVDQNLNQERTRDIYEDLLFYEKPPMIPLPPWEVMSSMEEMGIRPSALSRLVTRTLIALTGFRKFYQQLPNQLEDYLKKTNMRGAGLFALINSASLALIDDPRPLSPFERAATLIFAAYQFYDDLMSGRLEPDTYNGQPLEMGQYPNLFSTSLTIDRGRARLFKSKRTDQITVIINGHYFLLNVGHPGKTTTLQQLTEALQQLQKQAETKNENSPGPITGAAHPTQLRLFSKILKNEQNRSAFLKIRHSFLTLCLDLDTHPEDYAQAAKLSQSSNFHNRWYHSSLQFVVFGNARACTFCSFNAYLDGNPMMRGSAEFQKRAAELPLNKEESSSSTEQLSWEKLNWQIPTAFIERAMRDIKPVIDDQQATFVINDTGKTFFKQHGLAPVPAFMAVIDMAVKKLIGRHANIAQYLSLSKYRYMNLANANATTPEVKRFVELVEKPNFAPQEALQALHQAIESQREAYRNARKYLPPSKVISIFMNTQKGLKKIWVTALLGAALLLLRLFGQVVSEDMEIIASHPDIRPEVPVLGRPGIRLPYVRYFGFHYQIMDDKIVLSFMPSVGWKIPNEKLFSAIQEALAVLKKIVENAK